MPSRRISDLHLSVQDKVEQFVSLCKAAGIDLLITCTFRSCTEQMALYAQGRKPLAVVNALRKEIGLYSIPESENIRPVTKALPGQSLHNYGLAVDVVPLSLGKPVWDNEEIWQKIGEIGEACGLEWYGHNPSFKEFPHFQYTGGLSLKEIQGGKMPKVEESHPIATKYGV